LQVKTINPKKRTGENIMSELMVFHNKNENNDGSAYTLKYLTPVTFPINETELSILAKKASVNSIHVRLNGNTDSTTTIPVNPQTFEITFQIGPIAQPLPPIIIKGTGGGGGGLDQPVSSQPSPTDEFVTQINEANFPAIRVNMPESPDTIEFLIQSSLEIYTGCMIFSDKTTADAPVTIPLEPGFIITCRQEL
jgi:hypothetical protein